MELAQPIEESLMERLLESSGLPWTVLRATQFHDLILTVGDYLSRPPVVLVPRGVQNLGAKTLTSALRGLVRDDPRTRAEFLALATTMRG